MKNRLDKKPEPRARKVAAKTIALILKTVCETIHPKGTKQGIIGLVEESTKELKAAIEDNPLSETLKSLVWQYQNCDTKVIKSALLAEIVKQLKFSEVRKYVDVNISRYG